jgi:hypothetical protein
MNNTLSLHLLLLLFSFTLTFSATQSLRLTVFSTTTFSKGDFSPSPNVLILPGPINISDSIIFSNYCSARLEGTITASVSNNYTIFVETEGSIRIFIDDH